MMRRLNSSQSTRASRALAASIAEGDAGSASSESGSSQALTIVGGVWEPPNSLGSLSSQENEGSEVAAAPRRPSTTGNFDHRALLNPREDSFRNTSNSDMRRRRRSKKPSSIPTLSTTSHPRHRMVPGSTQDRRRLLERSASSQLSLEDRFALTMIESEKPNDHRTLLNPPKSQTSPTMKQVKKAYHKAVSEGGEQVIEPPYVVEVDEVPQEGKKKRAIVPASLVDPAVPSDPYDEDESLSPPDFERPDRSESISPPPPHEESGGYEQEQLHDTPPAYVAEPRPSVVPRRKRTPPPKPTPTMVEVVPGFELPLRGSAETQHAISLGRIAKVQCMECTLSIRCIESAEFVLCPLCHAISPLECSSTLSSPQDSFGVGLGFVPDD